MARNEIYSGIKKYSSDGTLNFSIKDLVYDIGNYSNHYYVGKGFISKIPKEWIEDKNNYILINYPLDFKEISHETKIAKGLYSLGINVPEPLGFFNLREINSGIIYPGFVMKNLSWCNPLSSLSGRELDLALKLRDIELGKARKAGYIPKDEKYLGNSLFDRKIKKNYLIDFELWQEY